MARFDRYSVESLDPEFAPVVLARIHKKLCSSYLEEDRGHATPCWIWQNPLDQYGYGRVMVWQDGRSWCRRAHRLAYALWVGPIPEGRELHHRCEVRACLNPDHLQPVTRREHVRLDGRGTPTHCKHGHEFTPENTHIRKNGSRLCRKCAAIRNREYQAAA